MNIILTIANTVSHRNYLEQGTQVMKENCPEVNIHYNTIFTLEFPRPSYKIPPQVTPQVTPQVAQLLETLQGEMTRGEIVEKLGLKDRMHFSKEYLTRAMKGGYIEMPIPEKPKSRLQKYRLTNKGKSYAAK